jgi:cell division septal protein FtsQ
MYSFKTKVKKEPKKKPETTKSPKPFPYKKAILALVLLVIVAAIVIPFYILYFRSQYFVVQDVVMMGRRPETTVNYSNLEQMVMGKNIFKLRLKDIKDFMINNYPELLDLQLTRAFPNSIIAVIVLREPVAQLYQRRYYPVDADGVILSGVKGNPDDKLPIISGVRSNLSRQVGALSDSRRIDAVLTLLKKITSSGILDDHTLVEIDISNIRNAIFFLEDGLEVKIGHEDYAKRLDNLKRVLGDPKLKTADIRYIDLRFKEPVIGPRWKR